jgi:hypothetical protein
VQFVTPAMFAGISLRRSAFAGHYMGGDRKAKDASFVMLMTDNQALCRIVAKIALGFLVTHDSLADIQPAALSLER